MKKLFFLFIFFLVGCTSNKQIEFTDSECNLNWSLCTVYPDKSFTLINKQTIKIAILDSGINEDHSSLEGLVTKSFNAINQNESTKDLYGHGTAIAGIIAAKPNNYNVQGISNSVELYDVKVLNDKGGGKIEDVISGIEWSINNDADIINLSFGFQKDDDYLRDAIRKASDKGITIVAASGNNLGLYTDYPAKYDEVISFSSVNKELKIDPLAGKGKVDYVAPGVEIPILTNDEDQVRYVDGTSFAAAIGTGVIANILAESSNQLTQSEIKTKLTNISIDLGEKGKDTSYGYGLIQLKTNK